MKSLWINLALFTLSLGQDYTWPIKAAQSLSATFCEYRSGHLHSGIDIKTWGEMEVPCYAVADGHIARISTNYDGYGKAVILQLDDGYQVIYAHLERFTPELDRLIAQAQSKQGKYSVRLRFEPGKFPVRKHDIVAFSGTSGTEHPHLHFEIRDSSGLALNPQDFYPDIRDSKAPVLSELLIIPVDENSKVNNSRLPISVGFGDTQAPPLIVGPVKFAINTHDRANGTLNRYAPYHTELFIDDSLVYTLKFFKTPIPVTRHVNRVYPGEKGENGWRYMAMYSDGKSPPLPFTLPGYSGIISLPTGEHLLSVSTQDYSGNSSSAELLIRSESAVQWTFKSTRTDYLVTRKHQPDDYKPFIFYHGPEESVQPVQTLYDQLQTVWILPESNYPFGLNAYQEGSIPLSEPVSILPPDKQVEPQWSSEWYQTDHGWVLQIVASDSIVFPLDFVLEGQGFTYRGQLNTLSSTKAETSLLPTRLRARATVLKLKLSRFSYSEIPLVPFQTVSRNFPYSYKSDISRVEFSILNTSESDLFIQCDTAVTLFNGDSVHGLKINFLGTPNDSMSGKLYFGLPSIASKAMAVYRQNKDDEWQLIPSTLTHSRVETMISSSGRYFPLDDLEAPTIEIRKSKDIYRPGNRILFKIHDNTGRITHPDTSLLAKLDDIRFYPDWNPFRDELSFHLPLDIESGDHRFYLRVSDQIGNRHAIHYTFQVK